MVYDNWRDGIGVDVICERKVWEGNWRSIQLEKMILVAFGAIDREQTDLGQPF